MFNLKINANQGDENTSASRTTSSRPSAPNTDKDFRKILSEKDKHPNDENKDSENAKSLAGAENAVDKEEIAATEEKAKKQQPSLFDLSKGNVKKKPQDETADVVNRASADELAMESPNSIFKKLANKGKAGQEKESEEKLARLGGDKKAAIDMDEEKVPSRFPQESVDLTYVNPLALQTKPVSEVGDQKVDQGMASQKVTLQQLIDAVAKAITTAESKGTTDTVVTLKHPPLFAGSNIVLTSYESAKGEFNIRFENLTQQAKAFMDMQQNQDALLSNLQQKGYAVHIVVATTNVESPQFVAESQQAQRDQNSQQQEQQQQGRQQKDEEEA